MYYVYYIETGASESNVVTKKTRIQARKPSSSKFGGESSKRGFFVIRSITLM